MPTIKKYFSWRGWFYGLADSATQAGATAVATLLTPNGLEQLGVTGIGMNLKQFGMQVLVHVVLGASLYIKANKLGVVTEEVDTQIIEKEENK